MPAAKSFANCNKTHTFLLQAGNERAGKFGGSFGHKVMQKNNNRASLMRCRALRYLGAAVVARAFGHHVPLNNGEAHVMQQLQGFGGSGHGGGKA